LEQAAIINYGLDDFAEALKLGRLATERAAVAGASAGAASEDVIVVTEFANAKVEQRPLTALFEEDAPLNGFEPQQRQLAQWPANLIEDLKAAQGSDFS
jgi:hypothetical protein